MRFAVFRQWLRRISNKIFFSTRILLPAGTDFSLIDKTPNKAPSAAAPNPRRQRKHSVIFHQSSSVTRLRVSAALFTIIVADRRAAA